MTTEKTEITDAMIGGNASAEEASEACDDGSASGVDIVLANRLQQTAFSKKDYGTYIKVCHKNTSSIRGFSRQVHNICPAMHCDACISVLTLN